jgi:hypothetical protein
MGGGLRHRAIPWRQECWPHRRSELPSALRAICSVIPQTFLPLLQEGNGEGTLELVETEVAHSVRLVVPDRDPLTPSAQALCKVVGKES